MRLIQCSEESVAMKKDFFMISETTLFFFFFGPILPDWEMRLQSQSQTAKNSICIHKSRQKKMYCNIVKYHLDMKWKVRLRELPNSSEYVITLQRKSKCTLKCPFSVTCQYFIFRRTQPTFQEFHQCAKPSKCQFK